jgi:POT family proton-dependent oligopeptide transporter
MSTFSVGAPTVERHPPGLFLLFFVEMWERFSFYGMRALLVFYLIKGFMRASDDSAYAIYGAYGALVYATPYLGGMLADRLLGARLAVIWGAILMAAGHLLMTIEQSWALFGALALLICGNGFFKPNISTMVGALYSSTSQKRDAGFTIFYMGINLGAALAPLVCGYIGETYGWHYGFGLATLGMLAGLATFVSGAPVARALILLASVGLLVTMLWGTRDNTLQLLVSLPIAVALLVAGLVSFIQLGRGSLPEKVGAPADPTGLWKLAIPLLAGRDGDGRTIMVGLSRFMTVLVGTLIAVPIFALLVAWHSVAGLVLNVAGLLAFGSIFAWTLRSPRIERDRLIVILVLCFFSMLFWAFFEQAGSSVTNFTDRNVDRVVGDEPVQPGTRYENVPITQELLGLEINGRLWTLEHIDAAQTIRARSRERERTLAQAAAAAAEGARLAALEAGRPAVEAETEAARVAQEVRETAGRTLAESERRQQRSMEADEHARSASKVHREQAVLRGFSEIEADEQAERVRIEARSAFLLTEVPATEGQVDADTNARGGAPPGFITFTATESLADRGLGVGGNELRASVFQATNPIFILIFGLPFSLLWGWLGVRGRDPSAPVKFALGLFQLGAGFLAFWYGAKTADSNGMVAMGWLLLGYMLQTTGELCLSPVGLSLVTRLSPARMVSTIMGAWFLATAFSHLLAAAIAKLTGVGEGGAGSVIPPPLETVNVYGTVFGGVGIAAIAAGVVMLLISGVLHRMMHLEEFKSEAPAPRSGH